MRSEVVLGCGALAILALACTSEGQGNREGTPVGAGAAGAAGGSSPSLAGNTQTSGGAAALAGGSGAGPVAGAASAGMAGTSGASGTSQGGSSSAVAGSAGASSGGTGGAAVGGSGGNGGAVTGGNPDILVPATGALIGQYYGDASIAATATKLGRSLPLHLTYYAWSDDWTRDNTAADLKAGRVPFVNWELYEGGDLAQIIAGDFDTMLAKRATDAKALGKQLFLDLGAEMNGDWSPWSGAQNGGSAEQFVAMFRHVHDKLKGADNIVWLWCPNVTDEPNEDWNQALKYYPGDDYVDWTCVDGYNWGTSGGNGWESFQAVFKNIYPKLASKNKPIMIGEMASAEVGGDKAAWLAQIIPTLKSSYPLIKGLVWFDVNKETDWRISSSPASEAAFKALVNDPYFNP